jgi:GNAT superfamily N-acetyltransferase
MRLGGSAGPGWAGDGMGRKGSGAMGRAGWDGKAEVGRKLRIVPWNASDEVAAKACYEVTQAVMLADDPLGPPMSERTARVLLKSPSEPARTWFVPGDDAGSAAGLCHLRLPSTENRHQAYVWLEIPPDHRRRGIGLTLLRHAARQAAEDGRSTLSGGAIQGSAGEAFALRLGAKPGQADARRVLVLEKLPAGKLAELRESAARAAAGYSLVTWNDQIPDEYLADVAAVFNAMSDAPRDPGHEPRAWDAQRVRERIDGPRALFGSRGYWIAARHDATGEMAAITQVEVNPENPDWGHQQITAVTRQHRGHRLGLLVKAAMTEWLVAAEPALRRIVTWNAALNAHMIAINETLGYELLDPQTRSFEVPVAGILGAG